MDDFWHIEIIKRDVVPERQTGEWEKAWLPDTSSQRERSNRSGLERESDNIEKEGVVDHRETKNYT